MSSNFNANQVIRKAGVAGFFYPKSKKELGSMVNKMIDEAKSKSVKAKRMIVPHAGFIYSGPVAATAYKSLLNRNEEFERALIIGPSHHEYFNGLCSHSAKYFETPLGQIELDQEFIEKMQSENILSINNEAHRVEHCLEVQLPFLQIVLPSIKIVPVLFCDCEISQITKLIDKSWDDRTLILISTDLSHYHDYSIARKIDNETVSKIVEMKPEKITSDKACGSLALRAILSAAVKRNCTVKKLDVRSSGDTGGGNERVVGYGAFAIC